MPVSLSDWETAAALVWVASLFNPLRYSMPKSRQPPEIWNRTRQRIWTRDGKKCVRCGVRLLLRDCHIDHLESGKKGTNQDCSFQTLCRRCHALRLDFRHRGMTHRALRDGL